VDKGALLLLLGGVRGLQDEDGLHEEEQRGRVEQLQCRREVGQRIEYSSWSDNLAAVSLPAGKSSFGLTGCAENSMRSLEKTAPQTMATIIQIPA
jgi:hypothetical protein